VTVFPLPVGVASMHSDARFTTPEGRPVPAVTADEMRAVDRVATDEVGVGLLQMMEHAGRNLAREATAMVDGSDGAASGGPIVVAAGDGGNGGGGLCAARHLLNRSRDVQVVLDRPAAELTGAAAEQWAVLDAMGVAAATPDGDASPFDGAALVVDALVGYGLSGPLRGTAADLVERSGATDAPVLSLDVPSGVDATTGGAPGPAADPDRTLTLALPKTGLDGRAVDLVLADIGLPRVVFERAGVAYPDPGPFTGGYRVRLETEG
jgi:NAD(P)H-hydrate epimerase